MSRRLSKKLRSAKMTHALATHAANWPQTNLGELEIRFARTLGRRPSLRSALMVGTALGAGLVAGLINVSPAQAAGTCTETTSGSTYTWSCSGDFPTTHGTGTAGPSDDAAPNPYTTTVINVTNAKVGGNSFGNGVSLIGTNYNQTLEVTTDAATTIGVGSNYTVTHDGIFVHSTYGNTTIDISNVATIGGVGNDGIRAKIDSYGSNTITITNTGDIGSAGDPVSGVGISSIIISDNTSPCIVCECTTQRNDVTNNAPVFSVGTSFHAATIDHEPYNHQGYAYTNMTNTFALTSTSGDGIHGFSETTAFGKSSYAYAEVTVTNSGPIVVTGPYTGSFGYGIKASSRAIASTITTLAAFGGKATARSTITNTGSIVTGNATTYGNEGIYGHAYANADALSAVAASGGNATASVSITNTTAAITTHGDQSAIDGFSYAESKGGSAGTVGEGGLATATTTIYNSGPLAITPISGTDPDTTISGTAFANADAYGYAGTGGKAVGGTATAGVTITNLGALTSPGDPGIYGLAGASANAGFFFGSTPFIAQGGTASATVTINNSGPMAVYGDGIYGKAGASARAYSSGGAKSSATGGTATSAVVITNTAGITSADGYGIHSYSLALAGAQGGITGQGGSSSATTSITNTAASINSYKTDIFGISISLTDALGSDDKGGSAKGGHAYAGVTISNSGALTNVGTPANHTYANGIYGNSFASASGGILVIPFGGTGNVYNLIPLFIDAYTATGGTATANTTITNSGAIRSHYDGIAGFAEAYADAFGSFDSTPSVTPGKSTSGAATGGTATATVIITNTATIAANADGIYSGPAAHADAWGYHATGGTATATLTISNTKTITTPYGVAIAGYSEAYASGFGSFSSDPAAKTLGTGQGGTAYANTTITNSGPIRATYGGIYGTATAFAVGWGYHGTGGTATSVVSITNSANVTVSGFYNTKTGNIYGGGGISGDAYANADALGSFDGPSGAGTGGLGTGGTASATTTINNTGTMATYLDDIHGRAIAHADGYGYTGVGGIATARVVINNSATLLSASGDNIDGFTLATADGGSGASRYFFGIPYHGTGGTATAYTNINNSGKLTTDASSEEEGDDPAAIHGVAIARANGYGSYGVFGSAAGGTATATVLINNSAGPTGAGFIKTYGTGNAGIVGFALAAASGYGYGGTGGTAHAYTTVNNSAAITTHGDHSPGIRAGSKAYAYGNVLDGTGGTALAITIVNNSGTITTSGEGSPGIHAFSDAYSGGYSPGSATANTTVSNSGNISTSGEFSNGIHATSYAKDDDMATTTVNNSGRITTTGYHSDGVNAQSYAFNLLAAATALTTVNNSGTIITRGENSPGVYAYAGANALLNVATATVVVNNSGSIQTYGYNSAAIEVRAFAGGYSEPKSITVNNSVTGIIWAHDGPYHAVLAYGAPTTINNFGYIHGNVDLPDGTVNIFNNNGATGVWKMQGDSYFGGNKASAVNNSGTVSFNLEQPYYARSHDVATFDDDDAVVTLHGLQTFNNAGGLITMVNGDPYERIVIGNDAGKQVYFNGTGASRLAVDAFLGGPGSSADVLQIGNHPGQGYVTGVTAVIVNNVDPGLGAYNPVGIPVAESAGAANVVKNGLAANVAGNFTSPTIPDGLFQYNLFYLPKGSAGDPCAAGYNCWFLANTPSTSALELPQLLTAAQDIWSDEAGVWLDRTADLRDYFYAPAQPAPMATKGYYKAPPSAAPVGVGPGVWVRAFGDWATSNANATFSAFGVNIGHDTNYKQDTGGIQAGADFLTYQTANGALLVGAMGGAVDSTVTFASGTHVQFQGGDAGAYATYLNRGWFTDALFLANFMTADFNTAPDQTFTGGLTAFGADMNLQQLGGHIDTGYRFQFNPWFFEPEGTIEIVHTSFCGSVAITCLANGSNISFPGAVVGLDDTSVRGRLGGRVGTAWITNGWRVEPSLTGGVWQTLTGNNVATLTSNGYVLDLSDPDPHRTEGEIGGMINLFELGTGWSGFVKGDYRFATEYSEGSLDGGVRYQW